MKAEIKDNQHTLFVICFWRNLILDTIERTPKSTAIIHTDLSQNEKPIISRNGGRKVSTIKIVLPQATFSHFFNMSTPIIFLCRTIQPITFRVLEPFELAIPSLT